MSYVQWTISYSPRNAFSACVCLIIFRSSWSGSLRSLAQMTIEVETNMGWRRMFVNFLGMLPPRLATPRCRWKPQRKIKLISPRRGRSEKKHFEINDFLNFIVAHSFSINCRGSLYVTGFHDGHLLCNIQDRDFYITDVDKYEIKERRPVLCLRCRVLPIRKISLQ